MKKLIAISVVFALVAGVAFAADLSASVSGRVDVFTGNSKGGGGVYANGGMEGLRIEGAGEVMDGKFGAKVRFDPYEWGGLPDWDPNADPTNVETYSLAKKFQGYAWWKPIDQFKLIIGQSNATDGFWGKDGNSGWMFNQTANDIITGSAKGNIWGGGWIDGLVYRDPFSYALDTSAAGLYMEIKPFDILGINIGFSDLGKWDKGQFTNNFGFQVDLNLAFGNIALTYKYDNLYAYFGGSFGDLNLDVGLSVHDLSGGKLDYIYFGAAVKYSAGAFGVKVRTAEGIPVKGDPFTVLFGVLPYFAINDNMTFFFYAEMGMAIKSGLGALGWTVNPYLRVGNEWGPSFYAGFQIEQAAKGGGVIFRLPIGIQVGF